MPIQGKSSNPIPSFESIPQWETEYDVTVFIIKTDNQKIATAHMT